MYLAAGMPTRSHSPLVVYLDRSPDELRFSKSIWIPKWTANRIMPRLAARIDRSRTVRAVLLTNRSTASPITVTLDPWYSRSRGRPKFGFSICAECGEQVHLESVVGPRTELERTSLFVERKERDVDATRALRHRRNDPQLIACPQHDLRTNSALIQCVSTSHTHTHARTHARTHTHTHSTTFSRRQLADRDDIHYYRLTDDQQRLLRVYPHRTEHDH